MACDTYIELHASSAFSFLEASPLPEQLVERAAALGYSAVALIDRDGVHGAPRFYKAAQKLGIRPLVGSAVSMRLPPEESFPAPPALPLLVENRKGYQNLCRLITRMKLRAAKGEGQAT